VIEAIKKSLLELYVFPEVTTKLNQELDRRAAAKEYDSIGNTEAFCRKLTADLQALTHDKHLRVLFRAGAEEPRSRTSSDDVRILNMRAQNFGIEKAERLSGNVGYLRVTTFAPPPDLAGDTISAAMSFLANTNALIVDVRGNRGGQPATVQLLCSYLFAQGDQTHLNDLYWRPSNETQQFWVIPYLAGKRYDKPVFVLTSARTFSGAEEFAYDLQSAKRALVIGETTEGGAHPVRSITISEHVEITVPVARAINPVTKTDWEGVGVKPDIGVPADKALERAHWEALQVVAKQQLTPPLAREVDAAINGMGGK
jgi:C-terminal processing protease CtpA/Prc